MARRIGLGGDEGLNLTVVETINSMKSSFKLLLVLALIQAFNTLATETNQTFVLLHTAQGDLTNAAIWRVSPPFVLVKHLGGLVSLPLTNLPPELTAGVASNLLAQSKQKLKLEAFPPTASSRTWTLQSGQTTAGAYVSSGTETVVIWKDGTNCFLKISELSTNDQAYAARMKLAQDQVRLDAVAKQEQIASERQAMLDAIVGIYERDGVARSGFALRFDKIDLRSDGSAMLTPRTGRSLPGNWTFQNNSILISDNTFIIEGDDLVDQQGIRWLHIR